ncbi:SDR family NAD(P)-dependent oxidoreductase [Gordonia sp. SID5947]|uniref:SDR family NAD(P)-dependent oxidoreductase n=1 Tax=Gordonia sp. SID5947 TaxID=2690315 RepID=UPI001367AE46|nr:SDR family NAD(P)-dependent oxidoreductase [Gordonia sp. SID5947]MYR07071.1 SDR family NAD(P)-dependent oxidoreductase [Gordonia sp. SID5947]
MHAIVMTGATRGIGRAAALEMLRADPDLHLVSLSRSSMSGDGVRQPNSIDQRITTIDTDLADIGRIRAAVDEISRRLDGGTLPPLMGFVGNAGLQFVDALHETVDGLESTFAVNVVANHLLLRGLLDHLSAPARIVITVSDTHFGDLRHNLGMVPAPRWSSPSVLSRPGAFDEPDTVRAGRRAYSTSKLAAIHLVHEWSRRLPDGIDILAYNPSFVPGTGLTRAAGRRDRLVSRWLLPALTLSPTVDRISTAGRKLADVVLGRTPAASGAYVDRTRVTASSDESYDPDRERALWDFLEDLVPPRAAAPQ